MESTRQILFEICSNLYDSYKYVLSPKFLINVFNYFLLLFDGFSDDQKRASETLAAFIDLTNQVIRFSKITAQFSGWFERSLQLFAQFKVMSNKIMNLFCDLIETKLWSELRNKLGARNFWYFTLVFLGLIIFYFEDSWRCNIRHVTCGDSAQCKAGKFWLASALMPIFLNMILLS